MGVGVQHYALTALPGEKTFGTYCTGDWVDPRAGVDWCGKSRPHHYAKCNFRNSTTWFRQPDVWYR